LTVLCGLLAGCRLPFHPEPPVGYGLVAVTPPPPVAPPPPADPGAAAYATNNLLEGDLVTITFQYSTNFNATQKIALDGTLNLQGAGLVKAAGKTALQLQNELTELYQSQVKDDPITIKVIAAETAVYVAGAVTRPGKIAMERPLTVLQAIMEVGGYDPYRADLAHVLVLRVENGRQKTYRVNLKRVLSGRADAPFYLQPFDVIQVTTKTFNF
jgi:polysaccharide export outer membrane protein